MRTHAGRRDVRRRAPAVARPSSDLVIGRAADRAERSADRFAADLMADLERRPTSVQRSVAATGPDPLGGTRADPAIASRIRAATGGRPLPDSLRRSAEDRSGQDLGKVRVHAGAAAGELSEQLQATAFTVGSDLFFGRGAYQPRTPAGRELIAHEVAHVVQQREHTVDRATVQRKFGESKKKQQAKADAKQAAEDALEWTEAKGSPTSAGSIAEMRDQVTGLEIAARKLVAGNQGRPADYHLARELNRAATILYRLIPRDEKTRHLGKSGRIFPEEGKRLRRVVLDTQIVLDELKVEASRKQAQQQYLDAGRNAGRQGPAASEADFTRLTKGAKSVGFDDLGGQATDKKAKGVQTDLEAATTTRAAGKLLGLSQAEIAAIVTFTSQDYKYINPATANNEVWMTSANADVGKAKARTPTAPTKIVPGTTKIAPDPVLKAKQEGAAHAAVAMQGLSKLPVWPTGHTYRGEVLEQADFDAKYKTSGGKRPKIKAQQTMLRRDNISSTSKNRARAVGFWSIAAKELKDPVVRLLFDTEVTNGRDIEELSASKHEAEVVTLPGAEFKITEITKEKEKSDDYVLVKCKQVR